MARLWKTEKIGFGENGILSQIVPFSSDFPPISNQFHTFFLHFRECIFGNFSQFPSLPHFPSFFPFPPIVPHFAANFPFFRAPAAGRLIRLRLPRTLAPPPACASAAAPSLAHFAGVHVQASPNLSVLDCHFQDVDRPFDGDEVGPLLALEGLNQITYSPVRRWHSWALPYRSVYWALGAALLCAVAVTIGIGQFCRTTRLGLWALTVLLSLLWDILVWQVCDQRNTLPAFSPKSSGGTA